MNDEKECCKPSRPCLANQTNQRSHWYVLVHTCNDGHNNLKSPTGPGCSMQTTLRERSKFKSYNKDSDNEMANSNGLLK